MSAKGNQGPIVTIAGWLKQKGETIILAALLLLVSWQLAQMNLGLRQTEAKSEGKPTVVATVATKTAVADFTSSSPVILTPQPKPTLLPTKETPLLQATATPAPVSRGGVVAEGSFPGELVGPGYCEWWNGGSQSGIWVIRSGENLYYSGYGHWWKVDSDAALERLYPPHRDNFLASHPVSREAPPAQ